MKKSVTSITNPDDLDKALKHTSLMTWIILGIASVLIVSFFVWSLVFKIPIKISGVANISSGEVTLNVDKSHLNDLMIGQKVFIGDKEGEILFINDDGQPIVSSIALKDGEYTYYIVIKEVHPFDFLIGK